MITATFQINRALVEPLLEHVYTNNLPLNLTVTTSTHNDNGCILQSVVASYAEGDSECLNQALSHVVNEYAANHGRC